MKKENIFKRFGKWVVFGIINFFARFWYEFSGLIKKDYLLLLRRKKYLYLTLAFPLLISLIYVFILSPKTALVEFGACDFDNTPDSVYVLQNLKGFSGMLIKEDGCVDILIEKIKKGDFMFGLVIPEGFTKKINNLEPVWIEVYYDNSDPSLANFIDWKINLALEEHKKAIINDANLELKKEINTLNTKVNVITKFVGYLGSSQLAPIEEELKETEKSLDRLGNLDTNFLTSPVSVYNKGIYTIKNNTSVGMTFIFPIIALFVLLMLVSTNIIFDKKINFLARLRTSRTSNLMYLVSKLVFFLGITIIQFLVVLGVFFIAGASFSLHWGGLLQVIVLIALTDVLLGILIGLVSESEGIAILISLLFTMPFMFLSGMFYPLKLMPSFLQWLAYAFPLNNQIFLMKKVLLFKESIFANSFYLVIALFIICYLILRKKSD